eukprot:5149935-Prymnesium_polylepis.1
MNHAEPVHGAEGERKLCGGPHVVSATELRVVSCGLINAHLQRAAHAKRQSEEQPAARAEGVAQAADKSCVCTSSALENASFRVDMRPAPFVIVHTSSL